ncbi:hypothetical protein DRW41_10170 [Neobacillus piezotolerans]|uniref:Uncharacterized protein n=1 Tax=Neobacillus piezotolerans TaxID=2259171 RepID=A0A3D8GRE4_9BACI|nr:hypothetical protein [Neobacillus piezotolerans]RDU37044.1 hypothetical protein DRW41_10170 [Neobacillus piezotolerans]
MDFSYKNEILSLKAFEQTFKELKEVNPEVGNNIEASLRASVAESHQLIEQANSIPELHLALLKEQTTIQAQNSQYLSITDEINQKKIVLLEFKPKVYHEFMDEVESEIGRYFSRKAQVISAEIKTDGSWYSGLRDSAKKGGGSLINATIKGINTVTKEFNKKEIFSDDIKVDSQTIVERLLAKHLDNKEVSKDIGEIFTRASKSYEKKWSEKIMASRPNLKRLSAFSLAHSSISALKLNFQLGATEQVLATSIGAAIIGVASLAAGWHTLTYAMLTVFPPLAVFAAIVTIATGILTKEKAIEKRQAEAKEAINRYYQYFIQQLYTYKMPSLGYRSISLYMEEVGENIVAAALKEWEKGYFENISLEHFRSLNQAFVTHLMYVNEAIDELD